jgi:ATP-dependent helicase Lhr and Lhr-like helicase
MAGVNGLAQFHPVVKEWFNRKFGIPTDVQNQAWEAIRSGKHTLIAAPTGSGKTLAALLPCLDAVIQERELAERDEPGVKVLYITPLKALNNDIHEHVFGFAEELQAVAEEIGCNWHPIQVAVRTGDTAQSTRASMLRRPPQLLITTPESFYILMTSAKGRDMLRNVQRIIVDEIHDLAGGLRGAHLSVTLERLTELCGYTPQRIGVSATQKPLERVARFLGGWEEAESESSGQSEATDDSNRATLEESDWFSDQLEGYTVPIRDSLYRYTPRPVHIIESRMDRRIDIHVTVPEYPGVAAKKTDIWLPMVQKLLQLMESASTTLIFVNNRRLAERLTARLNELAGEDISRSHHGSVSREKRLEVERLLKAGELRCIVATSSLELGIDVGHVDLVLQIDSPQSAAAGIQRIGRAGHDVGGTSRGVIVARSRGALPEIAVLARRIAGRDIEDIRIPRHVLGVVSQQLVAMAATDDWELARLYRLLLRSDSYRGFPLERLTAMLDVLSGLYPFSRPLVAWEREAGILRRRPNSAMAAMMGAGTIPQSTGYPIHHAETKLHIGELDEEFVHEIRTGDCFQLGTSSWRIVSMRPDRLYVTEVNQGLAAIPFWRAEGPGRSFELGVQVGEQLAAIHRWLREGASLAQGRDMAVKRVMQECRFTADAADSLIGLVQAQAALEALPTHQTIVVELFPDEAGQTHVIYHSVFGRRFNRTWLLALQYQLERTISSPFYTTAKDNGFELIFKHWEPSYLSILQGVHSQSLEELLREAVPASPMFAAAFRQAAEMSLLLSRSFKRTPAWQLRMRSQDLLREALPYAAHFPLVSDAVRECMNELLDLAHVRQVLEDIERGRIQLIVREETAPSPFAAQFFFDFVNQAMYESDALDKDLQLQMLSISRELAEDMFGREVLRETVSPGIIEAERFRLEEGFGLELTTADEVYRMFKSRGDMRLSEWQRIASRHPDADRRLKELLSSRQLCTVTLGEFGEARYICADELPIYESMETSQQSLHFVLNRYIGTQLAFTASQLSDRYSVGMELIGALVGEWAKDGRIVSAPFATEEERGTLWTEAKLSSRLIRATLNEHRSRIESVDGHAYCARLLVNQHAAAGTRLQGTDGLREIIAQLQGLFLPWSHWESVVFPARLTDYQKEELDLLCASGEVFWLGRRDEGESEGRIAFFLYESKELYAPILRRSDFTSGSAGPLPSASLSSGPSHPELLALVRQRGASFLSALCRETGETPSELTAKLMELVWEGYVSNDQFAPVRQHASVARAPSARAGQEHSVAWPAPSASARRSSRRGSTSSRTFQSGLGRWFAVDSLSSASEAWERSAVAWIQQLFRRNGLVTRQMVAECTPYSWESIQEILRRLEDWGAAIRGFPVRSIPSVQFAPGEWIEGLRNPLPMNELRGVSLLSSVDPANPYGLWLDWPKNSSAAFARKPGNYMLFRDGQWLLWIENKGRKIVPIVDSAESTAAASELGSALPSSMAEDELADCLKLMAQSLLRQPGVRKVVVDSWNGRRIAETEAVAALLRLGAEADRSSLVLWPSSLR